MEKIKLIIANKSSYKGSFIDDGRLGLCGNDKFYILGENLELIKKYCLLKFLVKYHILQSIGGIF